MLKINHYNIDRNRKILSFIIALFIIFIVFANIGMYYRHEVSVTFNFLCIAVWGYLLILNLKLNKLADEEDLRQLRLGLQKGNKREHIRCPVDKYDRIRIALTVIKYIWAFKFGNKKLAGAVDISAGGVLVKTDTEGMTEGARVSDLTILFADGKKVVADGLIVRIKSDECAIKFANLSHSSKDIIMRYILHKDVYIRS